MHTSIRNRLTAFAVTTLLMGCGQSSQDGLASLTFGGPTRAPGSPGGGSSPGTSNNGNGSGGGIGAGTNGSAPNGGGPNGGTSTPNTNPGFGPAITLDVLAPDVPLLATYQSHNPKVYCRGAVCFLDHLEHRSNAADTRPDVFNIRFRMSTDFGRTWSSFGLLENLPSRPASLVGDDDGNIYVLLPSDVWNSNGPAWFLKYSSSNGYSAPIVNTTFAQGSAGKFTAVHDSFRRKIYYFTHNNSFSTYEFPNFFVLNEDGTVVRQTPLTRASGTPSQVRGPHYPYLTMNGSTLIAGWTNDNQAATPVDGLPPYESIHVVKSEDGGASWTTLNGTSLATPIVGDVTGPADRLTLDDESFTFGVTSHKWLSDMVAYQGSLHAFYLSRPSPDRQHYVRYDLNAKAFTRNTYPRWGGAASEIHGLDGFFVDGGARLFAVGSDTQTNRIVVLVSPDGGTSWQDYASVDVGAPAASAYAIAGHKRVLDDGSIVGVFTRLTPGAPNELVRFVVK